MSEKDPWITLLQEAKKFGPEGFTHSQIEQKIGKAGDQYLSRIMSHNPNNDYIIMLSTGGMNSEGKMALSFSGHVALLEYEQLQQARESARDAKKTATWAIRISIAAFIASIIFSIISLSIPNKTILIEDKTRTRVEEIEGKVESLYISIQDSM